MAFEAEHGNDGIAEGSEVLWGVAFGDLAGVFVEGDIPHVVRTVFDAPVAAPPGEQLSRIRLVSWNTADGVVDLCRLDPTSLRGTNQATDLGQSGPVAVRG